ncbi:MAG TPA: response regulator [Sphaerochaeta sp.]|nr:response regulator [Sphaerochaeta sp.]
MIRVVIVEDEKIIRRNLIEAIDWAAEGCKIVAECRTAEEGLEAIALHLPQIIVTDINLPGISGIEMLDLASERGYHFEPIIITGYGYFEYAKRAIELSVVDYILKPIDERQLQLAVQKALQKLEDRQALKELKGIISHDYSIDQVAKESKDIYVQKVLEVIGNRYTEYLSIDAISEEVGLSPGYLSRKLKAETGMSLLELHHRHRIEVAVSLIKEHAEMKYYEIAEMVGFASYKRFSLVFKKYCGCAPRDLRKREGDEG